MTSGSVGSDRAYDAAYKRSYTARFRKTNLTYARVSSKGMYSISGGQIPRSLLRLLEVVIVARMSEYIHQSHNVSVLMYHLVCPAKYRRVVFDASVDTVLKEVCLEIAKRYAIIFLEIGTDKDHVHFLIQSIPTYSPTKIVKTIKSITAREVLKRVPAVKKHLTFPILGFSKHPCTFPADTP